MELIIFLIVGHKILGMIRGLKAQMSPGLYGQYSWVLKEGAAELINPMDEI